MGILDRAKAFAHVGVTKAGRAATSAAAKGVNLAADAAGKGAASANEAAGKLRDASTSEGEPARRREDDDPTTP